MPLSSFRDAARAFNERYNPLARIARLEREKQERDERIVEVLADNAELKRLMRTDPLTGLANRRGGDEMLESFYNQCIYPHFCRRGDGLDELTVSNPRGIIMLALDLDHFKKINDTYGHEVGDEALIKVADELQKMFPKTHNACVVRQGGEEIYIAMMAHQFDLTTVGIEAGHFVRRAIARYCPVAEDTHQVTASIGVAYLIPGADIAALTEGLPKAVPADRADDIGFDRRRQQKDTLNLLGRVGRSEEPLNDIEAIPGYKAQRKIWLAQLFKQADASIYAAKAAGRNRVYWWNVRSNAAEASDLNPQAHEDFAKRLVANYRGPRPQPQL